MKNFILRNGVISGVMLSAMMLITATICYRNEDFEGNMVLGYAYMLLSLSLIFVGIKNHRDKVLGGRISFGQALRVGLYISLVASTIYVVTWLFYYYLFIPDFMDKYTAHVMRMAEKGGATAAGLQAEADKMKEYGDMYRNPLLVVLFTYAEVFPIGLLVSLLAALILKRKSGAEHAV